MNARAASTRFVLIGHPVRHSLSPVIHAAAYRELGLEGYSYDVVDCPGPDAVARQFDALRRGELAGANVTLPWKRLALELADEADPSARETGAANVIRPTGANGSGRLVAHNTDVPALAEELRRGRADARSALVIGNGGAALAAVVACRSNGISRVVVVARKWRGTDSTNWPGVRELGARGAEAVAWPEEPRADSDFWRAVKTSDVIVQSTTDGMSGATDGTSVRDLIPWSELGSGTFAYDVVYNPALTPFIAAARSAGLRAESGLGMLVGQAALAVELWIGRKPDTERLLNAASKALAESRKP